MSSASSSWSVRQSPWELRDYSRLDGSVAGGAEDDSGSDLEACTAAEASEQFFDYLVELKLQGTLSAKHCCELSFWATKAGMTGKGTTLAYKPEPHVSGGLSGCDRRRSSMHSENLQSAI